ncbi:MAG: PilZ domain-containing protein [Magnetococcales bacterium]|nr:PilZ domain-containing protein [Magnetococcales bacterium]
MPEVDIKRNGSLQKFDEVIQDPARIRSLLSQCLSNQDKIELQIGEQVRIYFSRLAPPPSVQMTPPPPSQEPPDTAQASPSPDQAPPPPNKRPTPPPDQKESLYLEPMEPPIGNAQIRKHPDIPVTMRFFNRMQTMEGKILFLETAQGDQGSLLRFTLPGEFGSFRQRRHYRVNVIDDYPATLTLHLPGKNSVTPKLHDISFGGLACIFPGPADSLPLETKVTLSLEVPDEAKLNLVGYVRNHEPVPHRPGTSPPANSILVGIQLDQVDRTQEDRLNSMVGRIQQAFLASVRQKESELPRKETDNRKPSELAKLMALKKKKKLGFF